MTNDALDFVREDCRHDAMVDGLCDVRRRWPYNDERDDEDYVEAYDELEDVKPRKHDW